MNKVKFINNTIKFISRLMPLSFILDLLAWKIHSFHNLREAAAKDCDLCRSYFELEKNCIEKKKESDRKVAETLRLKKILRKIISPTDGI